MSTTLHDFDARIASYATGPFDDMTLLPEAGIDSLSVVRLAVEFAAATDMEIDATRLVAIRTIGDLKMWLLDIASVPPDDAAA